MGLLIIGENWKNKTKYPKKQWDIQMLRHHTIKYAFEENQMILVNYHSIGSKQMSEHKIRFCKICMYKKVPKCTIQYCWEYSPSLKVLGIMPYFITRNNNCICNKIKGKTLMSL